MVVYLGYILPDGILFMIKNPDFLDFSFIFYKK